MPNKKILVKEGALLDFFKSFFKAKSKGTESQWLQSLRKQDPKLADIWKDYDDALSDSIATQYRILKSRGISTDHLDRFIKKHGIKQP